MRPQTDPTRRCLPVAEWPDADRIAWQAALAADDPCGSSAARRLAGDLPLVTRTGAATVVG
jgi:hypothetical protein